MVLSAKRRNGGIRESEGAGAKEREYVQQPNEDPMKSTKTKNTHPITGCLTVNPNLPHSENDGLRQVD